MNTLQHHLLKLSEECNEIGKLCSKSMLFGLDSVNPETGQQNIEALHDELNDLLAVIELLNTEYNFNFSKDDRKISNKIIKMNSYMRIAQQLGNVRIEQ